MDELEPGLTLRAGLGSLDKLNGVASLEAGSLDKLNGGGSLDIVLAGDGSLNSPNAGGGGSLDITLGGVGSLERAKAGGGGLLSGGLNGEDALAKGVLVEKLVAADPNNEAAGGCCRGVAGGTTGRLGGGCEAGAGVGAGISAVPGLLAPARAVAGPQSEAAPGRKFWQ